ncbi:MAG: YlbF family regulator [Candidatus Omnitrophica bacterium]|nr:YlbF family regulator [Candidatus Omnitrophota bacterium]
MNNLYQKIKEFAEAIHQTEEFQDYQEANEAFQNDKEAQKLLQDFQQARQTLAIFQQGGFPGIEEQREKTEKLLAEVRKNKVINKLLQAQNKMQRLIDELTDFLSNELNFPFTPSQQGGCCG